MPLGTKGQVSYSVWQSWNRIYLSFILLAEPLNRWTIKPFSQLSVHFPQVTPLFHRIILLEDLPQSYKTENIQADTTHNITPTVKRNVVCSSSNKKLNFIKIYNNCKQNNQAPLPSPSTKVASHLVSCDLQSNMDTSRLWTAYRRTKVWAAYRQLPRVSLATCVTKEHVEHENHEKYGDTRTTRWSQNEITAMATLHRRKRGHKPQTNGASKHPSLSMKRISS